MELTGENTVFVRHPTSGGGHVRLSELAAALKRIEGEQAAGVQAKIDEQAAALAANQTAVKVLSLENERLQRERNEAQSERDQFFNRLKEVKAERNALRALPPAPVAVALPSDEEIAKRLEAASSTAAKCRPGWSELASSGKALYLAMATEVRTIVAECTTPVAVSLPSREVIAKRLTSTWNGLSWLDIADEVIRLVYESTVPLPETLTREQREAVAKAIYMAWSGYAGPAGWETCKDTLLRMADAAYAAWRGFFTNRKETEHEAK